MATRRARHTVWSLAAGATAWMVWNRMVLWHDAGWVWRGVLGVGLIVRQVRRERTLYTIQSYRYK
jgi:hypothetical protein